MGELSASDDGGVVVTRNPVRSRRPAGRGPAERIAARNRDELDLFRESPRVRLVSIAAATAERHAVSYASLRSIGQPIPTNDLWIAASALERGTELVTLDRDFANAPQILVALCEP